VTRNFTAIYLDWVLFNSFTVTRSSLPSTGTGKKHGTATQTAPNQTAGPLVVTSSGTRMDIKLSARILHFFSVSLKYSSFTFVSLVEDIQNLLN
jgi:hypothetical protein